MAATSRKGPLQKNRSLPVHFDEDVETVLKYHDGEAKRAQTEYADALRAKSTAISTYKAAMDAKVDMSTALRRLTKSEEIEDFWLQAAKTLGPNLLMHVQLDLMRIYETLHHRPNIPLKDRDRTLDTILGALGKLSEDSTPATHSGALLDKKFSPLIRQQFRLNPARYSTVLKPKQIFHLVSLNKMTQDMGRRLKKSKASFNIRLHKRLQGALQRLEECSAEGNDLGAVLEIAFGEVKKQLQENESEYLFNAVIKALRQEIEKLKQQKIFYTPRNVTTRAAKKTHLVKGYAALVEKVYRRKKYDLVADMLCITDPALAGQGLMYEDVRAILRKHR